MGREYEKSLAEETEQNLGNQPARLPLPYETPLFKNNISKIIKPKFRDSTELSPEQLTDPDYRLKQLEKLNRGTFSMIKWSCSRCHHCR